MPAHVKLALAGILADRPENLDCAGFCRQRAEFECIGCQLEDCEAQGLSRAGSEGAQWAVQFDSAGMIVNDRGELPLNDVADVRAAPFGIDHQILTYGQRVKATADPIDQLLRWRRLRRLPHDCISD